MPVLPNTLDLAKQFFHGQVVPFDNQIFAFSTDFEKMKPLERAVSGKYVIMTGAEWILKCPNRTPGGYDYVSGRNSSNDVYFSLGHRRVTQVRKLNRNNGNNITEHKEWFTKQDMKSASALLAVSSNKPPENTTLDNRVDIANIKPYTILNKEDNTVANETQQSPEAQLASLFEKVKPNNASSIGTPPIQTAPVTQGEIPAMTVFGKDILANAGGTPSGGTPPINSPTETITEDPMATAAVQKMLNSARSAVAGMEELSNLFFNVSAMHAYVTSTAAKVVFRAKDQPMKDESGKKIEDTSNVKLNSGKKYLTEKVIKPVEVKPNKILGVVMAIPAHLAGADPSMYFRPQYTKSDQFKGTDTALQLMDYDSALSIVVMMGRRIVELQKTHEGCNGDVEVNTPVPKVELVNGVQQVGDVKKVAKSTARRSLLIDTNYIPIKVYQTKELGPAYDEATLNQLNISAFERLNVQIRGKLPYQSLRQEDRDSILLDGEGQNLKITSRFITNDVNSTEKFDVPAFYSRPGSVVNRSPVYLPLKEWKTSEKSGGRYDYITKSMYNPEDVESGQTALDMPEYATALSVCGDIFKDMRKVKDTLTTRAFGSKKSASKRYVDTASARELIVGSIMQKRQNVN